jgi:1-aminocyclopropane-1-carboxylate deaminase/D-cysteine desulfhydrase-like pyridoxal-dependent ACC family enzyme
MRSSAVVILVVVAVAAAGCGVQSSSATKFKGDAADVAQVVEDIQTAGERQDESKMCALLTESLRSEVSATGSTCAKEMEKAIKDADAFELEVQKVTVTGTTASAVVKGEANDQDKVRTFTFAKEGRDWRASSFGS